MKSFLTLFSSLLISFLSISQTTFTDGDIAFTRINMDNEQFSFLFLVNVSAGTEFFITDHAWNGTGFYTNESVIKFDVNNAISAGDVCHVNPSSLTYTMASSTSPMTISSVGVYNPTGGNMLGSGGDNLFAYQNSPSFNVIAGVNANAGISGSSGNAWSVSLGITTAGSAIPTGQSNGADGFVGLYPNGLNSEVDNARYKSVSLHSGSKADLLAELLDYTKWEFDNGTAYPAGTTAFSVTLSTPPVSASITSQTNLSCPGASTGTVTATATDGTANYDYAWSNGSSTINTSSTTNTISSLVAGTYTVTITDDDGNTSTASTTLTTAPDNTAPTITVCASTPSNISANGSCQGTAPDLTGSVTATDNCTASPTITQSPAAGATLGLGTTTLTLTATDGSGNTATCTVNQTVVDNTAPVITVCASTPSNITANGSCQATAPNLTGSVTASDNCTGSPTITQSPASGATLGLGTTTITLTATDGSGNTATCTVNQTVVDNTAPTITVCASTPGNITANTFCQGTAPDLTGSVTATDNCTGSPTITQSPTAGATLGLGTTTITLTAWDGSGNTATCTVNQTVVDNVAPIITVCASTPSNLSSNGSCQGTAPDLTGSVTATDNCTGSPTITQSPTAGATLGLGTTTITLTATDGSGNTATCTVNQTVIDITAPTITVCASTPSNISSNGSCQGTAPDLTGSVTATDNCTGSPTITQSPTAGATLGLGTTTITLTATDGSGNTATCTVNQTVIDNTAPTITACASTPSNLVGNSSNQASATDLTGGVTATDNCTGSPTITQSPAAGATLGLGTTTITLTATDGSGNTATCTVNQTVISGFSASISSQTNLLCNGAASGAATATGVSGSIPYSYAWSDGQTTPTAVSLAAGSYTVTVTDNNGSTATTSVLITEPAEFDANTQVIGMASCNGLSDGNAYVSSSNQVVIYSEGFEGYTGATTVTSATSLAGVTGASYSNTGSSARLRLPAGSSYVRTGSKSFTLDVSSAGTFQTNFIVFEWDLSTVSHTDVDINFYFMHHGDEPHSNDRVWIRGSNTDPWIEAYNWYANRAYSGNWKKGEIQDIITLLANNGQSLSNTFGLRFGQHDNFPATSITSSDGLSIDDISVVATVPQSYNYLWSNSSTNDSLLNVSAGTYQVTVSNQDGCQDVDTVTITEPATLIAASIVDSNVTCNGLFDGGATTAGTGGTMPYNYAWSNTATTASITGVMAATYSVTITDANGCTDSASAIITEPAVLVSSAVVDSNASCNGFFDGGSSASATGGTMPFNYAWNNGATTASITGVTAATYSVTITDANGCTDSSSVSITEPTTLSVSANAIANTTNGLANGSAGSVVNGGTMPYVYAWSNGVTTATNASIVSGSYSVSITDANGCSAMDQVTLTNTNLTTVSVTAQTNVGCNGDATGAATATGANGIAPYTYAWSNGGTSSTITGLVAGTYIVTVTDNNAATNTASVTITEPAALTAASVVDSNVTCNGLFDGGATASGSGGTMPYNYAWSNTAVTASITGVAATNYNVTVTDANSCTATSSVTITEPATLIAASIVDSNVTCNGLFDGGASSSGTGGTMPYNYAWSNAATTASITGVIAANYSVTITDANGCTDSTNTTITEPATLISSALADSNVSCNGFADGGATVSAVGGTMPFNYVWNTAATTASVTGVIAATYSVTITDANGCTDSTSIAISEPQMLQASTVVDSNASCNAFLDGGSTVSGTGGTAPYSYSWSNSATTASITGVGAGTYDVTLTDANGCSASSQAIITEPTQLVVSAVVDSNATCNGWTDGGASANVSGGTGVYTRAWAIGSPNYSITGVGAGTYVISVTDANGCIAMDSAIITEPAPVNYPVVVDANVSCNGLADGAVSIALGQQTTVVHFEGFENYTGSGTHTANATLAGLTGVEFSTSTSQGRLRVPASAAYVRTGNFSATMDATVTGASPDPENFISTTFDMSGMSGSMVTLDFWFMDHGEEPDANDRTWIRGDNSSPWIEVYNFVSPNPANGVWTNVVVNNLDSILTANGQTFTSTFGVRFGQQDNFPSTSTTASDGITIDDISIITTSGSGLNYAWSNGDSTSTLGALTAGTYTVTITDGIGCSAVDSATVTEPTTLVTLASVDTNLACGNVINGAASVTTSGGTPMYSYLWSTGDTTSMITGANAGIYTVVVTDSNGCNTVDTLEIEMIDSTISFFAAQDITVYLNSLGEALITAQDVDNGTVDSCGIVSMTIDNNYFNCSNLGANTVIFTAEDGSGNIASDSILVTVLDTNAQILFGNYNMIEPNCNGTNDGKILTTTAGGHGPYNYQWSNGSSFTNLSNLSPNLYLVTVTDQNGCTQVDSVEVTEPDTLLANLSATAPLCFGNGDGMVATNVTGGTMPYSYNWNTTANTDTLSGVFAGNYVVTITDSRNCNTSAMITLSDPDLIDVTVTPTDVLCSEDNNGSATVSAVGGVGALSYEWHDQSTGMSISNLTEGNYQVTVTDTNMCEMITNYIIDYSYQTPSVDLGGDQVISWQSQMSFDAGNTGSQFNWSTGDTNQIIDVFVNSDTTIWVTVNNNGCIGGDTVTIDLDIKTDIIDLTQNELSLYPNPTQGLTQIEVKQTNAQEMFVRVLDITGALIETHKYGQPFKGSKYNLDLSTLSVGIYFIQVNLDKEQFLFKVNKL